jgi:hypothetical protein
VVLVRILSDHPTKAAAKVTMADYELKGVPLDPVGADPDDLLILMETPPEATSRRKKK